MTDEKEPFWFKVGDVVRLTGKDWEEFDMMGETVTIIDIDFDSDPLVADPSGGVLCIYTNPDDGIDYSAELVLRMGS